MKKIRFVILSLSLMFSFSVVLGAEYKTIKDIPYRTDAPDDYARSRCVLDVYYPAGEKGFKTLVWFHGGGLEGGGKYIPELLKGKGICVVAVNYRLSPKAKHPAYIEDATAAIAWTVRNIGKYGGDSTKVYVGGHSAGGYLTLMAGLDDSYLEPYGIEPASLAGFYPISGQTMTHYTIRKEMGLPMEIPYLDKYAPLAHIRKDTAPIFIIVGQAALEMDCRTAENYYLFEALKSVGNERVKYHELSGFDHGSVCDAGLLLVLRDMGVK